MTNEENSLSKDIDFDSMAAEDQAHFETFRIYFADYPLILGFATLFVIVFLQFFTRYVLNDSLAWTEEAARYLLILLSFGAGARCQFNGSHIVLEFVDRYYGRALPYVRLFALLITMAVVILICYSAFGLIQRTQFQQMLSLPFPKYYLYAGVLGMLCINLFVMLAQLIGALRDLLRGK